MTSFPFWHQISDSSDSEVTVKIDNCHLGKPTDSNALSQVGDSSDSDFNFYGLKTKPLSKLE